VNVVDVLEFVSLCLVLVGLFLVLMGLGGGQGIFAILLGAFFAVFGILFYRGRSQRQSPF